jgi:thiol:disulfide interchange protein DsbC
MFAAYPYRSYLATLVLCLAASFACAAQDGIPSAVVQTLSKMVPGTQPDSIVAAPVPGLYEVMFGPHVVYVTGDGKHMFRGDLIDAKSRINLTAGKRDEARAGAVEKLGEDSMIVFSPKDPSYTVTVFTDVDCGYCAKLHSEVAELNALGIKVRYLAFPRAGVVSDTYDTMVSVWCADNPQKAMTAAKQRRAVSSKTCENPVKQHFAIGQLLGVNGTPTIILENGEMVPGYLPPRQLLARVRSG